MRKTATVVSKPAKAKRLSHGEKTKIFWQVSRGINGQVSMTTARAIKDLNLIKSQTNIASPLYQRADKLLHYIIYGNNPKEDTLNELDHAS